MFVFVCVCVLIILHSISLQPHYIIFLWQCHLFCQFWWFSIIVLMISGTTASLACYSSVSYVDKYQELVVYKDHVGYLTPWKFSAVDVDSTWNQNPRIVHKNLRGVIYPTWSIMTCVQLHVKGQCPNYLSHGAVHRWPDTTTHAPISPSNFLWNDWGPTPWFEGLTHKCWFSPAKSWNYVIS